MCLSDPTSPADYIFKASLNGSREKAKEFSSRMIKKNVLFNEHITPYHISTALPSVLDTRASMALMTMPRLEEENRMKNDNFTICLKRKLRLRIIDDTEHYICKCGQQLDPYGDHCLACTANTKTKASNGIRDGIVKTFQRILPVAKLIDSGTQVEMETHNIVQSLPRLKPFDLSIRLDHSLDNGSWRTHLSRIGFDVTIIHATRPSISTPSEAATYTESDLRLRDGEKQKFARRNGGTNKLTRRTLSADEVIGEIINGNNSFIPIAVGPNGEFGSLFRRFLHGSNPLPLPSFRTDRPNATRAAELSISNKTPFDILGRADRNWKREHGDKLFGGSYLAPLPSTWANQRLGLVCQTNLSNHIRASLTKIKYKHGGSAGNSQNTPSDADDDIIECDGWKFYDGPLDGDVLPDDEIHGHDTAGLEVVDGFVTTPARNSVPGVT